MMYFNRILKKRYSPLVVMVLISLLSFFTSSVQTDSYAAGTVEPDDFDFQGRVENVLIVLNEGGDAEQGSLRQRSIMINGVEYFFTPEAEILNIDVRSIDLREIVAGAYVCFNTDPSDMIVELYVISNTPEAPKEEANEPEDSKASSNQPNGSGDLHLKNGVWVN